MTQQFLFVKYMDIHFLHIHNDKSLTCVYYDRSLFIFHLRNKCPFTCNCALEIDFGTRRYPSLKNCMPLVSGMHELGQLVYFLRTVYLWFAFSINKVLNLRWSDGNMGPRTLGPKDGLLVPTDKASTLLTDHLIIG